MRFVLSNFALAASGGSETYLLTVGHQLQRLGHDVVLYAHEVGPFADHARERGVEVVSRAADLPRECDVVVSQDAVVAYELAERFPAALHVFRACSDVYDFELPPQLDGVVDFVVAASDRVARCVEGCAVTAPLLRLRQPIDIARLVPSAPIRARPRRAVMLGNYAVDHRRALFEEAWGRRGVEIARVGGVAGQSFDVSAALAAADIVIAKGRAALDAMACGRAVYVCDAFGTDGWVTPDSYAALEADNFGGLATHRVATIETVGADLDDYHPGMGAINRDLAVQHHSARKHAIELLAAVSNGRRGARLQGPLDELGRLMGAAWSQERLAHGLRAERTALRGQVIELEERLSTLQRRQRRLEELTSTRRVRLALSIGRLAGRVRSAGGALRPERFTHS